MSDRELLDRIRAVKAELLELIAGADVNLKYHTKAILGRAYFETSEAEAALAWHVEDAAPTAEARP